MSSILPTQAYELKLAPHPAPTSVLRFSGKDAVSELYQYDIEFTSPVAGIAMDQVVGRPAKFTITPIELDVDARMTAGPSGGEVFITGRKGVAIGDGAGAYIKLTRGKIILGSPAGEIELKGNLKVNGPGGGSFKFPTWSKVPINDVKSATSFGFSE